MLVPFHGPRPPRVVVDVVTLRTDGRDVSPWEATALRIEIDGRRDLYVDQHMEWHLPWEADGVAGDARLFHSGCHARRRS
jgi:hypothetical protein